MTRKGPADGGWPADDGPELPEPRRPGAGCLLAAIVAGIGLIIAAILLVTLLGTALTGVRIR